MHFATVGRGSWATRVERASLVAELAALRHAVRIAIFLRLRGLGNCDVGRGDLGKSRARKLEGGQLCCQRGFLRMSPTMTVVTSLKGSAAWPRLLRLSLLFRCCGVATCFLISRRQSPALETREGMKKKGRCQGFPR